MRAKDVSKNIGREVVFKVPLEELTYWRGKPMPKEVANWFNNSTPIILLSDVDIDGDVTVSTFDGDCVNVHRKFIKLVNKESSND